jgi:Tol biopolymer transport system component
MAARFSPDSHRIAFNSDRSGNWEIWLSSADGSEPKLLTTLGGYAGSPRWSPDGSRIAFDCDEPSNWEIYVINAQGGAPRRLTSDPSYDIRPSWSRDGKWVYFTSNRSGRFQIWKIPEEGGEAVQVTQSGGTYASESIDGKRLFFSKPPPDLYLDTRTGGDSLWKKSVGSEEEIEIVDRPINARDWGVTEEGLYWLISKQKPGGDEMKIEFYSFDSGEIRTLFQQQTSKSHLDLDLSPDGKWFIYSEWDLPEGDIMLVENFR